MSIITLTTDFGTALRWQSRLVEIGVSQGRADEVLRAGRASYVALHFAVAKH